MNVKNEKKMKGTLSKTESGWEVWYAKPRTDNQNGYLAGRLPLINKGYVSGLRLYEGLEVEFDIIHAIIPVEDGTTMHKCAKLIPIEFQTKPGFVEKRTEQMLEHLANEEFKNVGDEGLFPNHTDKDIWIAGFKAGYLKK